MAGRSVAYAPQEFTLFQDLTVEETLRLAVPEDRSFRARLPILEDVFPRMLERLRQRAGTLSGGEQKMLLMSRAVLARPRVMLIDEISEGLQPTMIARMAEVLRRIRAEDEPRCCWSSSISLLPCRWRTVTGCSSWARSLRKVRRAIRASLRRWSNI